MYSDFDRHVKIRLVIASVIKQVKQAAAQVTFGCLKYPCTW